MVFSGDGVQRVPHGRVLCALRALDAANSASVYERRASHVVLRVDSASLGERDGSCGATTQGRRGSASEGTCPRRTRGKQELRELSKHEPAT